MLHRPRTPKRGKMRTSRGKEKNEDDQDGSKRCWFFIFSDFFSIFFRFFHFPKIGSRDSEWTQNLGKYIKTLQHVALVYLVHFCHSQVSCSARYRDSQFSKHGKFEQKTALFRIVVKRCSSYLERPLTMIKWTMITTTTVVVTPFIYHALFSSWALGREDLLPASSTHSPITWASSDETAGIQRTASFLSSWIASIICPPSRKHANFLSIILFVVTHWPSESL